MIKVSVFYPDNEGAKFDMDYYCNSHIPDGAAEIGRGVQRCSGRTRLRRRDTGIAARLHCHGPPVFRLGRGVSDRVYGPHAEAIMADIPNYTDIQPTLQISDVKI